jgi:hypothetical protein
LIKRDDARRALALLRPTLITIGLVLMVTGAVDALAQFLAEAHVHGGIGHLMVLVGMVLILAAVISGGSRRPGKGRS